jgi:CRISPR-associated protein Cas2
MAADSKWYLICYDVRNDKRLRHAAKHLEGYGERLQFSVFRCWLSKAQAQRLRWELTEILEAEDDVLFIPLCPRCVQGIRVTHEVQNRPDWPEEPSSHKIV